MARTKSYERQILNAIKLVNRRLLDIERKFGTESKQYKRYVNAISAALPKSAYNINVNTGKITVSKSKMNLKTLKTGQFASLKKLPTAAKSVKQSKKAIAKNLLLSEGYFQPTKAEIEERAISISDQQALEELIAKNFIEDLEDESGRLKYDDSVKEEMQQKGTKTYSDLRRIIEEGYRRRAEKQL